MMKVLVTGSLGSIGAKIIPLLAEKFELNLTDVRSGSVSGRPVLAMDITDYHAVLEASRDMDAVLHLAIASERTVVTDVPRFHADEGDEYLKFNELTIDANVRGTYHIYEAARQNEVPRVVYGSSLTVLIGTPAYEAVHDDLPPRPSNFYGVSKLWGEQLGEYFSRKHGLRIYCLRFGTPHPQENQPLLEQWLKAPAPRRNFVTYRDLARSVTAALEADGPLFGAYTITSSSTESVFDLSKALEIRWRPNDFVDADGSIRNAAEGSMSL